MVTLGKKDKAILRTAIAKGMDKDYENAMRLQADIIRQWKEKIIGNEEAYEHLHHFMRQTDKELSTYYWKVTGGNYLSIVGSQLRRKVISVDDIQGLSEEAKEFVLRYLNL